MTSIQINNEGERDILIGINMTNACVRSKDNKPLGVGLQMQQEIEVMIGKIPCQIELTLEELVNLYTFLKPHIKRLKAFQIADDTPEDVKKDLKTLLPTLEGTSLKLKEQISFYKSTPNS
jgi:hypothetical protein